MNQTRLGSFIDRTCTRCNSSKSIDQFVKRPDMPDGRDFQCKDCANEYSRNWRKTAAGACTVKRNNVLIQARRIGVTADAFREIICRTEVCEVCGDYPSMNGGSSDRLHVDHCHKTGVIRGVLCLRCNTAIGLARDDSNILRKLAEYLG
jgi:hypothetical protein